MFACPCLVRICFDLEAAGNWYVVELIIDLLFCLDVALNFRTTIVTETEEITSPTKIFNTYAKGWFFIDLGSSLPLDLLVASYEPIQSARLLKFGKIFKVVKFARLSKIAKFSMNATYLEMMEEFFMDKNTVHLFVILKLLFGAGFVCHVVGCFWALTSLNYVDVEKTWLSAYPLDEPIVRISSSTGSEDRSDCDWLDDNGTCFSKSKLEIYLISIYWAMTTMSTCGYGDLLPGCDQERVYAIFAMLIGGGFYGLIIASMSSMISTRDVNTRILLERRDLVQGFMDHHNFPRDIQRKVRRHFKHLHSERSAIDEVSLMNSLNPDLRTEVSLFLINDAVFANDLLKDLPRITLYKLLIRMTPLRVAQDANVITEGVPGSEMYVVFVVRCEEMARRREC